MFLSQPTLRWDDKRKAKAFSSSMKKTRGSRHQRLFKENVKKTKKRYVNFEKKGLGVVYA